MRVLFFTFLVSAFFIFTFSAAAQTPALQKSFDEAIETARRGDFETASEKFRRVLLVAETEKTPDDFSAKIHFNLGVCLYRLKKTEKAVAEFNEAIELSQRKYGRAFYALGMAHSDLKNFGAAEKAFRDALKLNKNNGEAWFDLGFVFLQKKHYERAETAFQNAVKLKSVSSFEAHNNLGVISALRHEFDAAEKHFETALKLSENRFETARNNLRFCRFYRQKNQINDLFAKLEFSN